MKTSDKYLIAIAISFIATGAFEPLLNLKHQQSSAVVHMLFLAFMFFGWCKAHIKESQVVAPSSSALLCGLIGLVGVPLYFYRTFGLKVGSVKCLKALIFLVSVVGASLLATYLVNLVGT